MNTGKKKIIPSLRQQYNQTNLNQNITIKPSKSSNNIFLETTTSKNLSSNNNNNSRRKCLCTVLDTKKNAVVTCTTEEVISSKKLTRQQKRWQKQQQQQQQQKYQKEDDDISIIQFSNDDYSTAASYATASTSTNAGTSAPSGSGSQETSCSSCCERILQPCIQRNEEAKIQWKFSRERCSERLIQIHTDYPASSNNNNNTNTNDIGSNSNGKTTEGCYNISELQYKSQHLRDKLNSLKNKCSQLAIEVASKTLQNEERRSTLQQTAATTGRGPGVHRNHLKRLERSIIQGSMQRSIHDATEQLVILRIQWALQAFKMYRLDVSNKDIINNNNENHPHSQTNQQQQQHDKKKKEKKARGIGKIGGLPLPHAGPELYSFLPPLELQSALRLVASLTSTVARCFGIVLPHPILLQPNLSSHDIIDDIETAVTSSVVTNTNANTNFSNDNTNNVESRNNNSIANSKTEDNSLSRSLISLVNDFSFTIGKGSKNIRKKREKWSSLPRGGINAAKGLLFHQRSDQQQRNTIKKETTTTGQQILQETSRDTIIPPSMDPSFVSRRIRHATAAILAEGHGSGTDTGTTASHQLLAGVSQYALSVDVMKQDEFAIALQLLQNNIVALCIRCSVPVSQLWPAQAILLNLKALQLYCEDQIYCKP